MYPEGEGRREYPRPGEVVEHEGKWWVVVSSKFQDNRGNDFNYAYAWLRPATEEEAAAKRQKHEAQSRQERLELKRTRLATQITSMGERPVGINYPEGKRVSDRQNVYGSGDWFVIGDKYIWYVANNGMDGDDWSQNNVATGGAGAIGWRVPYSKQLAEEIESLEGLQKALVRRQRDSKEPIRAGALS